MSVVCPRSNGTVSTHILTALTVKGVKRLLTTSRSPLAAHVLKWILKQVEVITAEWQEERRLKLLRKSAQQQQQQQQQHAAQHGSSSASSGVSQTGSPLTAPPRKLVHTQDERASAKTSPSSSPASSSLQSLCAPVVPLAPLSPALANTPFCPSADLPSILKPAAVAYKPTTPSASQQLSVMVRDTLFTQADKKLASSPSSPHAAGGAASAGVSGPSTPTSANVGAGAVASPAQTTRSAFSKVPAFGDADRKGDGSDGGLSPTKRLSPVARSPAPLSAFSSPSGPSSPATDPVTPTASEEVRAAGEAGSADKPKSPSLTALLEAIRSGPSPSAP